MKNTLKKKLFLSFVIVFSFTVFNRASFADDSGSFQQKKHSGLENSETANQHEKESFSNQSLIEGQRKNTYITTILHTLFTMIFTEGYTFTVRTITGKYLRICQANLREN
jgi:hypothetical protein